MENPEDKTIDILTAQTDEKPQKLYTETISFRVSPQMKRALSGQARERGVRESELYRQILSNHLYHWG